MKKNSIVTGFAVKALLVVCLSAGGFGGSATCYAQSIIGKWKGGSSKLFYSAEYAKGTGKSEEEKSAKDLGNYETEFKSDHTYVTTLSLSNSEVTTMRGTWSLSGNQLNIITEPKYNPSKTTLSCTFVINGNTLVTTAIFPPPARMVKTIATLTRM
jgi:hypothetical protein